MNLWTSISRNLIAGFMFRLVLVYALLMVPWRGFTENYVDTTQGVIRAIFGADDARHNVTVEPLPGDPAHPYNTRIVIVNNALMNPDGSGPIRNVDFDTMGMSPATLLIALILATPVSWRRKGLALLTGVPIAYVIALLFLGFSIWDESSEIGLVAFNPVTKQVIEVARNVLTTQLSLSIPALIWLLTIFRREDLRMSLNFGRKMVTA